MNAPARRLDPEGMLVFGAIARAGGVRGAAAELGMPRSTISRRLSELEAQIGAPLAVRSARRFALTELGTTLAEACRDLESVLDRSEQIVRRTSREPAGTLRIAAAPVIGEEVLPEIVAELLRRHPRLSIDVRMSVDYVDLRRGDVDVAVRTWPLRTDATDLFTTQLGVSTTGCWASPRYLEERGIPRTPADLASHECLIVGGSPETWTFADGTQIAVAGRARVDSLRLARSLAAQGAGILRTARMFAEPLVTTGELAPVLERHWPKTPLHAIYRGASTPEPKVRAFLELLREAVPRALGAVGGRAPRRAAKKAPARGS